MFSAFFVHFRCYIPEILVRWKKKKKDMNNSICISVKQKKNGISTWCHHKAYSSTICSPPILIIMFKYVDISLRSVFSLAFSEAEVRGSSKEWRKETSLEKKNTQFGKL